MCLSQSFSCFLVLLASTLPALPVSTQIVGTAPPAECGGPCQDNEFCRFEGAGDFCNLCYKSYDETSQISAFLACEDSTNNLGNQDCMNQCIPNDAKCTELNNPCPARGASSGTNQFCTFTLDLDDGGYCATCEHETEDYHHAYTKQCSILRTQEGLDACKEACFETCSSNDDCAKDWYCTFEEGDGTGYCNSCLAMNGIPGSCLSDTVAFEWTTAGEVSCLERCFTPCNTGSGECASDDKFDSDNKFCRKLDDDNANSDGYCETCYGKGFRGPDDCFLSEVFGVADPDSSKDCAASCFGECSQDTPPCTQKGYVCDFRNGEDGYCIFDEAADFDASASLVKLGPGKLVVLTALVASCLFSSGVYGFFYAP